MEQLKYMNIILTINFLKQDLSPQEICIMFEGLDLQNIVNDYFKIKHDEYKLKFSLDTMINEKYDELLKDNKYAFSLLLRFINKMVVIILNNSNK